MKTSPYGALCTYVCLLFRYAYEINKFLSIIHRFPYPLRGRFNYLFFSGNMCLCTKCTLVLCSSYGWAFVPFNIQLWESFYYFFVVRSPCLYLSFDIYDCLHAYFVLRISVTLNCFLHDWNNNNEEKKYKLLKRYERITREVPMANQPKVKLLLK